MDAIDFSLKQAFRGTVTDAKYMLYDFTLTAARYNMLYALLKSPNGLPQSELSRILAYHRSTTSKMVKRLVELKMLVVRKHPRDRRQNVVCLSIAGRIRIQMASDSIGESGSMDWVTMERVNPEPGDCGPARTAAVENVYRTLLRFRHRVGDTASLTFDYDLAYIPFVEIPRDEFGEPFVNGGPRHRLRTAGAARARR